MCLIILLPLLLRDGMERHLRSSPDKFRLALMASKKKKILTTQPMWALGLQLLDGSAA